MRGARSDRTIKTNTSDEGRGREVVGITLLGVAAFSLLSVISLQLGSGTLMGPFGNSIGLGIYALFGVGAYLVALGMATVGMRCLQGRAIKWKSVETLGILGIALCAGIMLHLLLGAHRLRGYAPGGLIGEYTGEFFASLFGRVGTGIIATTGLFASMVVATPISFRNVLEYAILAGNWSLDVAYKTVALIFPEATHEDDDDDEGVVAAGKKRGREDTEPSIEIKEERSAKKGRRRSDEAQLVRTGTDDHEAIVEGEVPSPIIVVEKKTRGKKSAEEKASKIEVIDLSGVVALEGQNPKIELSPSAKDPRQQEAKLVVQPQIVEPVVQKPKELLKEAPKPKMDYIPAKGGYHLPELSLLDFEESQEDELDRNAMLALAERLQKTLADYGVKGSVVQIHPGPVVTMYEFVPAPGTKLSKITALSNDLAMSLEALRVRIVAPIPGKGSVGIEVPNKGRATVWLKEILVDEKISQARSKLTLGLGKDIAGQPVAVDLAKMPHLLVAGTTGSGKSVAVNGMICSILFNSTPEEVRMIMIDPKMVELSIYEGIPHLLLPVVTDPKKANLALRWAVDEMERRYEMVSKAGVRDIATFNKKIEKHLADGPVVLEAKKIKIFVDDENGEPQQVEVEADEMSVVAAGGQVTDEVRGDISAAQAALQKAKSAEVNELPDRKLPMIVVIIDEFADLMMVAPKDVETSVARIAQKARAVGIHLILATQRPSVDVITGLIKANFPSRMAFQVASKIDSRTILDQQGAENLLGMGDMLFTDRGQALRRIHGALVTDTEIRRLVDFLKEQGRPVYDMDILKPRENEDGEGEMQLPSANGDQMYDMAVRIVCETRLASVSMLQRRLQIGFNRAARLIEQMEKEGIVGAPNGSKPREVLSQSL